jgi:3-oxoacyl-[acyl-carrier protein] reductase
MTDVAIEGRPPPLTGKVAVVTGGSRGIGASAARKLAAEGAAVVIGYHSSEARAAAVAGSLPGRGHCIQRLALEDSRSVAAFGERVRALHPKVHILVNSAGFTHPVRHADLDGLSDEVFDAVLIANVRGPFSVIRALEPSLRASGEALIVNVSSVAGFTGLGSSVAYCAAKGALDTVTMSLARVLGPGIRVLSVSPAAVATDFVPGRDRAALERAAQATPLGRVVEPEDVADAILACATLLKASTGVRIVVDGGRALN